MAEREEITFGGELERIADADPFRPFTVTMASGQQYPIDATAILAFGRNVVTLMSFGQGYHVLRQAQMSELSVPGEP